MSGSVPVREGDRIRITTKTNVDGRMLEGVEGVVRTTYESTPGADPESFLVMLDRPAEIDPYWKLVGAKYGDAWIVVTPGGDDEHTTHNEWPDAGPSEGEPF